ncbi:MAG: bifunctional demethylmenaquinone methyltransferase/2-methoxy-6-polyprenyl-1,4-benzoquinol methylase UbiE [Nitrospira sp.]|nr:bifunctional demethylmenaquinone methyltransferase/2-methoxy-6-polyprenyl-1,4-benzoquinol methylase UbiE [bacterium]MBL7048757.1 bifunctional demethylmenaquinone methyltransferase/2-methoxy-6-polyprenyl-1,4-benzoquinol methylase UbiE [Nitrospira sp.]
MNKSVKDPEKIQSMFSTIAGRYDLLNRVLSLGIDRYWRKLAVRQLKGGPDAHFLDVATGTCDVTLEIIKQCPPGVKVTGVDFSEGMLEFGREKIINAGLQERVNIRFADVTELPFEDGSFDSCIIAFGIRNVQDYKKGISEMARVVKKGGKVVILEFTTAQNKFLKMPYEFYIRRVLPFIGELISGKKGAYKYLPASMLEFPPPEELKMAMEETGLKDVVFNKLTFGITAVHVGTVV